MAAKTPSSTSFAGDFVTALFALLFSAGAQSQTTDTAIKSPEALLAELKDLHLPEPPSIWPPAPGWWFVALMVILGVACMCYHYFKKKRKPAARNIEKGQWQQSALLEHQRLHALLSNDASANQVLSEASVLMRRVALARLPREQAATVQNEDWLRLLDELSDNEHYSNGIGRLLLEHPYRKSSEISRHDLTDLLALMKDTISQPPAVPDNV